MKRGWRIVLGVALAAALLLSMLVAGALVWGVPHDQITLIIDGETIDIPPLGVGHWAVAVAGVLLALLVALLIVPLALALGIGVPLAVAAIALLAVGTALALLLSPLLALAALAWWLWKRARRRTIAA